ncbi:MAG TPA: hypothetical protein VLS48_01805 [Anaerolineales bacterium]|nr:hypothetical protein [Anaerolineales bacterium]
MENRTAGIIATVVAVLLCGCPGLFALCMGAIMVPVSFTPGAEIDMFGSNDPQAALSTGLVLLCLGLLFIAIPVVVGFLTLRNRPAASAVIPAAPAPPPPPGAPISQVAPTMEPAPVAPPRRSEPKVETDLPEDIEEDVIIDETVVIEPEEQDPDNVDRLPPAL